MLNDKDTQVFMKEQQLKRYKNQFEKYYLGGIQGGSRKVEN